MSAGRIVLATRLFALGARRVSGARQKEALFAAIEAEVARLPEALFAGQDPERLVDSPEVRAALDAAVQVASRA